MEEYISWIPYMLILSLGFCYSHGLITGIAISVVVGSLIVTTVDMDKKRKLSNVK